MSERTICITQKDLQRLRYVAQMSDAGDGADLADLRNELARAKVVPADQIPPDVITMNSRVRLRDLDRDTTHEYTLVYPTAADYNAGRISVVAPIGAAMLGYREGSEIEWPVPGGRRRLRVEAVLYQPEAAGDLDL